MNLRLAISFAATIVMILVMQWQGASLVTPQSPAGIIDLEFARTAENFLRLRLFMDENNIVRNLYLDFLFIAAYAWFLVTACKAAGLRTGRTKAADLFSSLALSAALFDICENFLLLLILNGRFGTSSLQIVYFIAWIKFLLAGAVLLYLLISLFLPKSKG